MRYLQNISNWPDPGDQKCNVTKNYSHSPHIGNFPGKNRKQQRHTNMLNI